MQLRIILFVILAFIVGGLGAFLLLGPGTNPFGGNPQQVTGKALVGGPFTLTNHKGERVSEKDFLGKYMLVYFGFTYCPDICPAELQVISNALEKLGDRADNVTPVFITVDPKRDTVEQMADYVSNFHKRLVGLTGSEAETRAAAKAFRVYYAEVKDESSTAGYTVDHTSIVYLMGPDGSYLAHFPYGTGPDKMAEGIAKHL